MRISTLRHLFARSSSFMASHPPMLPIGSFFALIVMPSASAAMSRTMSVTSRPDWPGSRSRMNQAFSAKRQASRNSGLPYASHTAADRTQIRQRDGLPTTAVVGDRHEHDRHVFAPRTQQRLECRNVHVALERMVDLRVAALGDEQIDRLRPGVLDVGPGRVEVGVVRHHLPGAAQDAEDDLLGGPALVSGNHVLEREQVAHRVPEHVIGRRPGIGLVAVLDRGPLIATHRAGARVGEQIDQHVAGLHLEQVVTRLAHGNPALPQRRHPQRLHRVDAERLDDRAENRRIHAVDHAPRLDPG